jgi:xylan 1,4-beta-xylosidase
METIVNPILRGFNPDPSIVRVGPDYYIATSTFEWAPGIQLYHSRDLGNWRSLGGALRRQSQLDLRGYPASAGVWAPNLSCIDGRYYLVYTLVSATGLLKDTHNYLVWADDIAGDWSEPIYLDSRGFDPSLFRDADGRTWLVGMMWDYRSDRNHFAGISIREISLPECRFVGPYRTIFKGTELGRTEGPHLYRKDDWYYLLVAEGGTEYGHAVTIARSRKLEGPYEAHPDNPLLSSRDDPFLALQRAGHGDLVSTTNDEWYMVHLCGRPLPTKGRCIMGRETCIQRIEWSEDGWPRLAGGDRHPKVEAPAPSRDRSEKPLAAVPSRDDFDAPTLGPQYLTLRTHADESWLSLKARDGYLRLIGREGLSSRFLQSLVARRIDAFVGTAETCLEFEPDDFRQMAGLILYYDITKYYYLRISRDETIGLCAGIIAADGISVCQIGAELPIASGRCFLKAELEYERLRFSCSPDGKSWTRVGPELDASILSDEQPGEGRFTGAMLGLCCQDSGDGRRPADFDYLGWWPSE